MSTYDNLALSSRPLLYLSAPDTTDKSGRGLFALSSNTLASTGQPIIVEQANSFYMDQTKSVTVTGNPLFLNEGRIMEVVLFLQKPTQSFHILIDDDSMNSLTITESSIELRLFFTDVSSTISKSITIPVKDWDSKKHVVVNIGNNQATLQVNNDSDYMLFPGVLVESTNLLIGTTYTDYFYLMDGLGFYDKTFSMKNDYIDDNDSGHESLVSRGFKGSLSLFDEYETVYKADIMLSDFEFNAEAGTRTYILHLPKSESDIDYFLIKANDENVEVTLYIDFTLSEVFRDRAFADNVTDSIMFVVDSQVTDPSFYLEVRGISNANVFSKNLAEFSVAGVAQYSNSSSSIVNCPDGMLLESATYTGTWITGSEWLIPKSIEIVFKPLDSSVKTYVFYSSDGEVSFGPAGQITNYSAWLNGQSVANLSTIRLNQWNHLVLSLATPASSTFYLNNNSAAASTRNIKYLSIAAMQDQKVLADVTALYTNYISSDVIEVADSGAEIDEGDFGSGSPVRIYSFAWSISGAGG